MKSSTAGEVKKPPLKCGNTWAELYGILYDLLERRNHLLPLAKEFSLIDETLKDYFCGVPSCSIGEYKVNGFYREIQTCKVPKNLKNKCLKKDKKWVVEIKKQKP